MSATRRCHYLTGLNSTGNVRAAYLFPPTIKRRRGSTSIRALCSRTSANLFGIARGVDPGSSEILLRQASPYPARSLESEAAGRKAEPRLPASRLVGCRPQCGWNLVWRARFDDPRVLKLGRYLRDRRSSNSQHSAQELMNERNSVAPGIVPRLQLLCEFGACPPEFPSHHAVRRRPI